MHPICFWTEYSKKRKPSAFTGGFSLYLEDYNTSFAVKNKDCESALKKF